MAAADANLLIEQGSTFEISIQIFASDDTPRDLTGLLVNAQLRRNHTSRQAVDFTIEITTPVDGEFKLKLTANQTQALRPGRYVYDVEVVDDTVAPIVVARALQGIARVTPEVTKVC